MGASIATRMVSLAAGARTGLRRHLYDSSASLLWIRRLLALPFCFAAFSSSRFIASRGERVGGWPARLRGTERDLISVWLAQERCHRSGGESSLLSHLTAPWCSTGIWRPVVHDVARARRGRRPWRGRAYC